jgi:hypothetical protein
MPDALLQPHLMAWSALFGTVSFELFGQLHNVAVEESDDCQGFFSECVRHWQTTSASPWTSPGDGHRSHDERVHTDAVLATCMRHWSALAPLHRWLTNNVQGP